MCSACQGLPEKISQKSAALQELGLKHGDGGDGGEVSGCDFIRQVHKSVQACAALTPQVNTVRTTFCVSCTAARLAVSPVRQRVACLLVFCQSESVKQRLIQTQQLWDDVERRLNQLTLDTARTSQTLHHHHSSPQVSLQSHRDLHQQLQVGLAGGGRLSARSVGASPLTTCLL